MSVFHAHLGWGAGRPTSVDRDRLPQPYSDLGPDYCSDIPYDLGPEIYTRLVNINYKYCLKNTDLPRWNNPTQDLADL